MARLRNVDRVLAEVGQDEIPQQLAAVRMRVRAHPRVSLGRESRDLRDDSPILVEQLVGPVAPHPLLELPEALGAVANTGERDLVRAPRPFDGLSVDLARPGPPLRSAEDQHRPAGRGVRAVLARGALDRFDAVEGLVQCRSEALVHGAGLLAVESARDEKRFPAVATEQVEKLVLRDPREHGRVRDLVPVQVQDRKDGPVDARIEELVRVPARGEWPGLGLSVADDACHEEVGVVERRPEGVRQRIAELTALVDRAGSLRRRMARDPAGKRELAKELLHSVGVLPDVGVDLAVRPFEVRVGHVRGPSMARTGDEDRAQPSLANRAVEMHVDEVQARHRPEVAEQTRLHVLGLQLLPKQRVVEEVDLTDREVVRRAPVAVECVQRLGGQRAHDVDPRASDTKRAEPRRLTPEPARRAG